MGESNANAFTQLAGPEPAACVSLSLLSPGDTGRIVRVDAGSGIGRRLLDLGFVPGTELRVVRRAPLGDPVTYELRGSRICLRRGEAARIFVEPTPTPTRP